MRKLFLVFLITCFCPIAFAEEAVAPSADETDKLINEAIVPEKTVEKHKTKRYKKKGSKKVKKTKNTKGKKTKSRGKNEEKKPGV